MKPHPDDPTNDALHLGLDADGGLTYGTRIHALPEAAGTWSPATNPATTFTLDLSALPGGGANLVPKIAAERTLDVLTQDDTAVDFIELRVWACPPYTFRAGVRDDFALPPEAATPSADLRARFPGGTFKGFDDPAANRHFGHTFSNLPAGIVQAELELRMQPHADIPDNDALHLGIEAAGGFAFGSAIADLPEAGGTWTPATNPATVFSLDLGALPGEVDLIPKIAAEQRLVIYLQDDTAVDDVRLRVWTCPPPYTFAGVPVTGLGEADLVFVDGTLLIEEPSASGEDGLAIDLSGADGYCLSLLGDCPAGYWEGSALELAVTLGSLTQGSGGDEATLTLADLGGGKVGVRTDIDGLKDVRIKNGEASVVQLADPTPAGDPLAFLPDDACVEEVDWLKLVGSCRGFSVLFTEPVMIGLSDEVTSRGV